MTTPSVVSTGDRYKSGQPLDFTPVRLPPALFSEDPIVPQHGHERLVICIAGGLAACQQASISSPRMSEYARRCNAQFALMTSDLSPDFKVWNKYRVSTLAKRFKQTLLLDVDVMVSREAPDIFELCGNTVGVVDARPHMNESLLEEAKAYFREIATPLPTRLLNGGIIHFSYASLSTYIPPLVRRHWCHDQWRLSCILSQNCLKTTWLGDEWNTLPVSPRYNTPQHSYMMHAAGVADRVEHLRYLDLLMP